MKYVCLLLYLIGYLSFAQVSQFQIELVNEFVGASLSDPPNFYTNQSNDDGLNQIFQTHDVSHYEIFFPDANLPEPYLSQPARFNFGLCVCNVEDLISDLNAYSSVVKYASYNPNENVTNNVLQVGLVNDTVGIPTGFNGEIVSTNDAGLNTIFTDYNVRTFDTTSAFNYYGLVCSCDAEALKQELDNYSAVINFTLIPNTVYLLSTNNYNIQDIEVFPNPFKGHIRLNTPVPIASLIVYDVLGKQVYATTDINAFERKAPLLKTGVYVLRITDMNGNAATKKLVKQ